MTNNKSSYIDYFPDLEEANYSIVKSSLNDGFLSKFFKNNKGVLARSFATLIDRYAGEKKGQLFTLAINTSGYSTDPIALENYYQQHPDVIDGYFGYVDLQKLASSIGGDVETNLIQGTGTWVKNQLPAFVIGAGSGLVVLFLIKRKRRNKK